MKYMKFIRNKCRT